MKLRNILLVAVLGTAMMAEGADLAALRRQADASQSAITSPASACNSGDEPFSKFLVKFTTDASFNKERTSVAGIFALRTIADYRALVLTSGHESGYNQIWQVVDADHVKLVCGYENAPDYSYMFVRRPEGTWFLTDRVTEDF